MDGYPIATSVDGDVMWEGPVVDAPHVIITLDKRSVQALFLDKPVKRVSLLGQLHKTQDSSNRMRIPL